MANVVSALARVGRRQRSRLHRASSRAGTRRACRVSAAGAEHLRKHRSQAGTARIGQAGDRGFHPRVGRALLERISRPSIFGDPPTSPRGGSLRVECDGGSPCRARIRPTRAGSAGFARQPLRCGLSAISLPPRLRPLPPRLRRSTRSAQASTRGRIRAWISTVPAATVIPTFLIAVAIQGRVLELSQKVGFRRRYWTVLLAIVVFGGEAGALVTIALDESAGEDEGARSPSRATSIRACWVRRAASFVWRTTCP